VTGELTCRVSEILYFQLSSIHSLAAHRPDVKSLKPGDKNPLDAISAELVEVRVEFEPGDAKELVFNIRDIMVAYDCCRLMVGFRLYRSSAR